MKHINSMFMGRSVASGLQSWHHFSYKNYHDQNKIRYGYLRALNDDIIAPNAGFEMHPHVNLEAITYVVQGELTHVDSLGNRVTLARGDIQCLSFGTGLLHGQINETDDTLRILQLLIIPHQSDSVPNYSLLQPGWEARIDAPLCVLSGTERKNALLIEQDVNIHTLSLSPGRDCLFPVAQERMAYITLLEGAGLADGVELHERDAVETQEDILLKSSACQTHWFMIDMPFCKPVLIEM